RLGALGAYPYVAMALAGASLAAVWRPGAVRARTTRADLAACALVAALAASTGAIAFSHRLAATADGLAVYGGYDSLDLSFYAAWASESTHTVPPMASYYAGHQLNAAYFTGLVLAMVHRFADVPMLPIFFRYAWPSFLTLAALAAYAAIRLLVPPRTALLAVGLICVCGDLSYLAAWFLPHDTIQWDYLLWPTNFLSATAEVLHFNTWCPTLTVLFGALYAIVRSLQTGRPGWLIVGAGLL